MAKAEKAPDQTKCELSARVSMNTDGKVSGQVFGTMYSHRKKTDDSETFVSRGVELDADDCKKLEAVLLKIAEKHRLRVEARTYDERSLARMHARRKGEIAGEEA